MLTQIVSIREIGEEDIQEMMSSYPISATAANFTGAILHTRYYNVQVYAHTPVHSFHSQILVRL